MSRESINYLQLGGHMANLALYFYLARESQGYCSSASIIAATALQAKHSHENQGPEGGSPLSKYSIVLISAGCAMSKTGIDVWGTSLAYFSTSYYALHSHTPQEVKVPVSPEEGRDTPSNPFFSATGRKSFQNPPNVTFADFTPHPSQPASQSPSQQSRTGGTRGSSVASQPQTPIGPTGLKGIPNYSSNCFAISAYQLIKHNPRLYNQLFQSEPFKRDRNCDVLRTFDTHYDSGKCLTIYDMQKVRRNFLAIRRFSIPSYGHQDAYEALVAFAEHLPLRSSVTCDATYEFTLPNATAEATLRGLNLVVVKREAHAETETTYHVKIAIPREYMSSISMSLKGVSTGTTIDKVVEGHLKEGEGNYNNLYNFSPTVKGRQISREYTLHPDKGVIIVLKRFRNNGSKISTPISFPNGKVQLTGGAAHDVHGFVRHIGKTKSFGHYVQYQKIGEQWYLNNDGRRPAPITNKEALAAMQHAYILYAEQS